MFRVISCCFASFYFPLSFTFRLNCSLSSHRASLLNSIQLFLLFSGWRWGGGYVYVYCNLAFHFLRLTRGFHLVLHPQSFCSWTILLVVDKAACSPASRRASLTCWALTKGFFFSTQTPLCSLTRLAFKLVCVKKTNAGKFCWQLSCYFWNLASLVTVYFEKLYISDGFFPLWHYGTSV